MKESQSLTLFMRERERKNPFHCRLFHLSLDKGAKKCLMLNETKFTHAFHGKIVQKWLFQRLKKLYPFLWSPVYFSSEFQFHYSYVPGWKELRLLVNITEVLSFKDSMKCKLLKQFPIVAWINSIHFSLNSEDFELMVLDLTTRESAKITSKGLHVFFSLLKFYNEERGFM